MSRSLSDCVIVKKHLFFRSPMSASLEGMNEREGSGHEVTILYDYTAVNSDEISIDSGEVSSKSSLHLLPSSPHPP